MARPVRIEDARVKTKLTDGVGEIKNEGLSAAEKAMIQKETGWSDEIIDAISSMEEYEIYKKLDYKKLKSMVVNVLFAVISIGSRKMKWGVPTENVCSRDSLLTIKTEK